MAGVENVLSRVLLACVASNSGHARLEKTLVVRGLLPPFSGAVSSVQRTSGKANLSRTCFSMQTTTDGCVTGEMPGDGLQPLWRSGRTSCRCARFRLRRGMTPLEWLEGPQTTVFKDVEEFPALITAGHVGLIHRSRRGCGPRPPRKRSLDFGAKAWIRTRIPTFVARSASIAAHALPAPGKQAGQLWGPACRRSRRSVPAGKWSASGASYLS